MTEKNHEEHVETLLKAMTLEEKVSLLSGRDNWNTMPIERLNIPAVAMTDGPHGVRANRTGEEERTQGAATSFPTGVSMAASWDTALIERVGQALAEETRAMNCDILLAPCVNIVRTPLAGRNFESYSEDPYLAGRIGVAYVNGVQSQNIGTSLKHYACNNQEHERFRGSSEVDERTLREIYLPAFEAVVKESAPWTVMCAYNRINGVYASQHHTLLNEILRDEWGFEGIVVSDWDANHTIVESVKGGLDLEMPGPAKHYGHWLVDAVNIWKIEEASIDKSVRRILRLIIKSGKLDGDTVSHPAGSINTPEHQALARELAEASITLLKNDASLLPLEQDSLKSIALIGPNAAEARIGGGGSSYLEPPYRISPLDALQAKADGAQITLTYAQGCDNQPESVADPELIAAAVAAAKDAEVAIICAGMPRGFESEGYDRPDMALPGPQSALIEAVAQVNPRTIVVLYCGAPVETPWIDKVAGLILAYYPGQEGGAALANVLFGEVNPSGKLSESYPVRYADNPTYTNYPGRRSVRYGEGIFVGYRYYDHKDITPHFPFGFGLSYTTFEYGDLQAPASVQRGEEISISLNVKNSGERAGKEIIQLYVHDKESSLARPPKELKGFAKVILEPGESQNVQFTLDQRALSFYDPILKQWVAEAGEFEVLIGSSSRDIRARASFTLTD